MEQAAKFSLGGITTYSYSVYITLSQSVVGEVYYDTVVNFLFVILVGRYLEAMSKRQAVASTQRLLDLQPRGAIVLRDNDEEERAAREATAGWLVVAGSVISPGRIRELRDAGADAFTIGSAAFDGSFSPRKGALNSQIQDIMAACGQLKSASVKTRKTVDESLGRVDASA